MDPLIRTLLPRPVHPDLSPAADLGDGALATGGEGGVADVAAEAAESGRVDSGQVVAAGPFKVYSPGLADWEPGIDLREADGGLSLTTPAGHHAYAAGRFTVEVSPDGRILWILGRDAVTADEPDASGWSGAAGWSGSAPGSGFGSADAFPPVTVLMPADLPDLCSRMPDVEFADLDEAAQTVRRLTAATAAGRHTRHRFGMQRPGDLGLVVDPVDGEPVLSLLQVTDDGLEFRCDGRWETGEPADRIPLLSTLVPVTRGAIARYDRLERSPSMSLSLFDRYTLTPERFHTARRVAEYTSDCAQNHRLLHVDASNRAILAHTRHETADWVRSTHE